MIIYKGGKVAADQAPSDDATATKRGPKPKLVGGVRKQVYLDDDTIAGAMRLGNGELSAGLRAAVKKAEAADRLGERLPKQGKE